MNSTRRPNQFLDKLSGGDFRSIGNANAIARQVHSQKQFNELFEALFHDDNIIVMRAADAIEKITRQHQNYLRQHKRELLGLLAKANEKVLKWHLALLVSRVRLTASELGKTWATLSRWALDTNESRIVRVNSVQTLFDLLKQSPKPWKDFELTISELEKQEIPSIRARIRKIRKLLGC